jgi:hypothetical protein
MSSQDFSMDGESASLLEDGFYKYQLMIVMLCISIGSM